MFNTTFNFAKFPLPLRMKQFHYCRWLVNRKPKITILSASENRLRVYPYTVRFWLESEHDNFFFPPFSRLYNEKITRNAENVPHLALIKQNSEHKNHKNDSRRKLHTSALSPLEDFHARGFGISPKRDVLCRKFSAVYGVSFQTFPTLLAILASQFIAFDSLVKRNLSGPTQWKAKWKFLISPFYFISGASLPEITGEDLILSDHLVFSENNDHHRRLCRSPRDKQTNKILE